jgi:phage gpG-like protein
VSAIGFIVEYRIGNGTPDPALKRTAAFFERAGAEVANVGKHILPRLASALEGIIAEQFEAEGKGPDSGKWAPLSEDYAKWKEQHFPGMPILQRTGLLMAGLISSDAPTANRDISGDTLAFGTKGVPYASYHQTGTPKMPERPPIDLDGENRKALIRAARSGVTDAIREADKESFLSMEDFQGDEYEGQTVQTGRRGGRFIMEGKRKMYLRQRGGVGGRGREVVKAKYGPGGKKK